jgi:phospholipase C
MEGLGSESGAPQMFRRTLLPIPFAAALFVLSACGSNNVSTPAASAPAASAPVAAISAQDALPTATPIKHVVVIFGENRSFDHYFGTYPTAQNPVGEPAFTAAANTPTTINNLNQLSLLTANPNFLNTANNAFFAGSGINPFRLDRSQATTTATNSSPTTTAQPTCSRSTRVTTVPARARNSVRRVS